jgi:hypothetical protein
MPIKPQRIQTSYEFYTVDISDISVNEDWYCCQSAAANIFCMMKGVELNNLKKTVEMTGSSVSESFHTDVM